MPCLDLGMPHGWLFWRFATTLHVRRRDMKVVHMTACVTNEIASDAAGRTELLTEIAQRTSNKDELTANKQTIKFKLLILCM